ncbi:zinc finger protein 525-like [Pseudomyrmex gracilis]|uniref:zinc finger protein 525-like n=1 Tax=Pseudomyrmex gracilis TaxID=219809 RepID=UPI000995339A|nr:zinc finger protein 525-like [Pseudomyrmex gracilis]
MEQQVTIHSSCEKPYRCQVCDKRFRRKQHLTSHEAVHSSLRPHICDKCDNTYKIKQHLSRHYKLRHSDSKKPYKCQVYEKRFSTKHNLTTHEAVHSSLRPHICDKCDNTYKIKQHLRRHYKRRHSNSEKP